MAIDYSVLPLSKGTPRVLSKQTAKRDQAKAERECRQQVKARDKGRCVVPGCTNRDVEMHHIIPRSRSSALKWATSNNCLLCRAHHQLRHNGLIQVSGNADDEVIVTGEKKYLEFRL